MIQLVGKSTTGLVLLLLVSAAGIASLVMAARGIRTMTQAMTRQQKARRIVLVLIALIVVAAVLWLIFLAPTSERVYHDGPSSAMY